jgi:predicted nuclease of restriction endonuclease-like (RecB) superfamily
MRVLSRSNLLYMRKFAEALPAQDGGRQFVPQAVGQVPRGHVRALLDKLDDQQTRDWYVARAAEHGWSCNVLVHQIAASLHQRAGAAPSRFAHTLPAPRGLRPRAAARQGPVPVRLPQPHREGRRTSLEQAMMNRLQDVLLELGHGFTFVGREYRLNVDGAPPSGLGGGPRGVQAPLRADTEPRPRLSGRGRRCPFAQPRHHEPRGRVPDARRAVKAVALEMSSSWCSTRTSSSADDGPGRGGSSWLFLRAQRLCHQRSRSLESWGMTAHVKVTIRARTAMRAATPHGIPENCATPPMPTGPPTVTARVVREFTPHVPCDRWPASHCGRCRGRQS